MPNNALDEAAGFNPYYAESDSTVVAPVAAIGQRLPPPGVPAGAQPQTPPAAEVNITQANGRPADPNDQRVRLIVPQNYLLNSSFSNPQLLAVGGIIFPYTPSISYEFKADYSSQTPTHSNFAQYFYKNSSVSPINITAKFTVQNEDDADVYISTVALLTSLTKMLSGGKGGDPNSGAPPPICRLYGYGQYMLDNTPVVVASMRIDLPNEVDYYKFARASGSSAYNIFGTNLVPTISTISLTVNPIYSRAEMQKFSVSGWLNNVTGRGAGYL